MKKRWLCVVCILVLLSGCMNKEAKELGMNNSIFNNPHGLDINGGNLSTAYDMALLTSYAMKNDVYRKIVSTKK